MYSISLRISRQIQIFASGKRVHFLKIRMPIQSKQGATRWGPSEFTVPNSIVEHFRRGS